jgi:argininosuccinate lyase
MSELVQRYTASVGFDQRLWRADIDGSLAHAEMLAAQGIIGAQDLADIRRGMAQIAQEIEAGRFEWKLELEDVHLNIEARLTAAGGRRRQAAAHRPQPQRPGGHRRAAVAARRDRRPGRRCWPTCSARW